MCAGRHKFLQAINIDIDAIAQAGNALALSEINVVFRYITGYAKLDSSLTKLSSQQHCENACMRLRRAPLRSADHVRCTCRCAKTSAAKVTFEQRIFKLPQASDESEQVAAHILKQLGCHEAKS